MAARFWVLGTGNWSDTAHWSTSSGGGGGSAVPTSSDDVTLDSGSGTSATVTIDAAANANTITINKSDITLLHNFGSTVVGAVTLNAGTLDTNGQTCSWALFYGNVAVASPKPTLTMGASSITITSNTGGQSWQAATAAITYTANTATLTFTANNANINVSGSVNGASVIATCAVSFGVSNALTCVNFTRTGTAVKTSALSLYSILTVTGTCTIGGNTTQGVNRLAVYSNAIGTLRTITCAAMVISGDVDFMDTQVAYSGAPSWTNAGGAYIGDCLGNGAGVTAHTTASAPQTATGTASFTWSTHGWTSRVPLPQDDVSIPNAFSAGRTITSDMPRLGRNIDFTGMTGTPVWTGTGAMTFSIYGSLIMAPLGTTSGFAAATPNQTFNFAGRSAGLVVTSNGVPFSILVQVNAPGGVYTFTDDFMWGNLSNNSTFQLLFGSVIAQGNMTGLSNSSAFSTTGVVANTRSLTMGSGTWSLKSPASSTWSITSTTGLTFSGASATIIIGDIGTPGAKTFVGGGLAYGTVRYVTTGAGTLAFTGNNTFANLDLECTTARAITLPASGAQTVTGTLTLQGAAGQVLSLVSSAPGTATSIAVSSGGSANLNGYLSLSADVALTPIINLTTGGNWSATSTWAKGVVPTAASNVLLSGTGTVTLDSACVCRSLDCAGFTGTLSHTAAQTLTIGDATAGAGNKALTLVAGMAYTLGDASTSAISFNSTSTTVQAITTAGKPLGGVTFANTGKYYKMP